MCAKILIIDDDEQLINVHSMIFDTEGFEVATAHDGQSGIDKLIEFKPDLVLLDAMMPAFSGFDTLSAIKANSQFASVKVVMLTALSDEKMKERAMNLGADGYIVKSQLNIVELIGRIRSLIDND